MAFFAALKSPKLTESFEAAQREKQEKKSRRKAREQAKLRDRIRRAQSEYGRRSSKDDTSESSKLQRQSSTEALPLDRTGLNSVEDEHIPHPDTVPGLGLTTATSSTTHAQEEVNQSALSSMIYAYDIIQLMQDPEVSAAYEDLRMNPMNVAKHMGNPKIHRLVDLVQQRLDAIAAQEKKEKEENENNAAHKNSDEQT